MERYDPFAEAESLGIRVEYQSLRTKDGLWIPESNLIILRSKMRVAHQRSTLAHELGHNFYGHEDDRPKHEVQANRWAAERLIDHNEVVDLMRWSADLSKVASELDVSGRLLRVYLNVHRLAS
jgi:Zn-dependent peptidase ImmA (M78 family)